jgi:hypothetical protein
MACEFSGGARFANPWLAYQQHQTSAPGQRILQRCLQGTEFCLTSDEYPVNSTGGLATRLRLQPLLSALGSHTREGRRG